jgi:hypothetical protein
MADSRNPPSTRARVGVPEPVSTVIRPGGAVSSVDPTLEPFAEFALLIGSALWPGPLGAGLIYDADSHRYRDDYIHPPGYALTVSAQPGLVRAKAEGTLGVELPTALARTSALQAASRLTVEQFHRQTMTAMQTLLALPAYRDFQAGDVDHPHHGSVPAVEIEGVADT